MPTILNIETSTGVCSAALTSEGAILTHFEEFSGRNHATVLHSCKAITNLIETDKNFRRQVEEIQRLVLS